MHAASACGRVLAVVAGLAAVVLVAAGIPAGSLTAPELSASVATMAPSVVLGLLVLDRRPGNPVGALLVALGTVPLVVLALEAWGATATGATSPWPGAAAVAAAASGAWAWLYAPAVWLALLFPDGRLVSPRWRAVLVASLAVPVLWQATDALSEQTYVTGGGTVPGSPPLRLPEQVSGVLPAVLAAALLAVLGAGACSVVVRYRQGGELVRRQIRWFAFSVLLVPGALLACIFSYAIFGGVSPLGIAALGLLFVALPCAVVVAILRHDLYDIDRLISRTLAYTTVSALLAGLFVVTAFAAGTVLGQGSAPAAAVAAVLCTVSFSPLRRRVQAVVDRRFYRDRRVAMATVRRFVEEVRDGRVQPEEVEPTLQRALADPALRLCYRLPAEDGEGRWVDAQGRPVAVAPEAGIPVTASGRLLAVVLTGAGGQGRAALVREVVREARLPIELSRLQVQLRQALAETAASRARLVRAADDERRRLQRDLHDGAQQRLVALGLELRHAQHALPPNGPGRHTLDRAVEQLQDAVGELRRIAHGLRPAALDDGLPAALRSLVRSSPVRVELDLDDVTLPEPVTTAAYYVAAEAVANALKHANADSIRIALHHTDRSVTLAVLDDGIGGAAPQGGSGLTGIADRVATLAGTLRLHSPPGAGTRIEVVLPCAS